MHIINNHVVEFKQNLELLTFNCFLAYIWFENKITTEYGSLY